MSKTVKKFKLFDEIIDVKDEYARTKIGSLANTKRYGVYKQLLLDGNLCSEYNGGKVANTVKVGDEYGTTTNPFTTLDYAMQMYNKGETHIITYIKTSGVYVIKQPVLSDLVLRIQVQANNVTIIFDSSDSLDDSFELYNSMIRIYADDNVDKVKIQTTNSTNTLHFEQCGLLLRNVNYDGCIACYGCYLMAYESMVGRIESHGCKGHLSNIHITNSVANATGIYVTRGSHLEIEGANTKFEGINGKTATGDCMIKVHYATLNLSAGQNVGTQYANGIHCYASTLFVTDARYASFSNNSVSGNYITQSIKVSETGIGY